MEINCNFFNPLQIQTTGGLSAPTTQNANFQFGNMTCTGADATTTFQLIKNTETGAEFFIDKTINYGETLILVFFLLFAIFGIIKIIMDFWIPHRVIRKS